MINLTEKIAIGASFLLPIICILSSNTFSLANKSNKTAHVVSSNSTAKALNTVNYYQTQFRPLSESSKKSIEKKLNDLYKKNNTYPKVIVQVESGNAQREKVAQELGGLFERTDVGYFPTGSSFIGLAPNYPISIFINPKNKAFINELLLIIKPFISGSYKIIADKKSSVSLIRIYINGKPSFDANGTVRVE